MSKRESQEAAAGATFLVLGLVFTAVGLVRDLPGLWAPGVAFAAVGSAFAWRARRKRPGG